MSSETTKYDPFLKQHLGSDYIEVPFDELKISTATMDVRMHERTELNYKQLFLDLPVVPEAEYNENPLRRWPAGTIFAAKFEDRVRGVPPTTSEVAFKNSTMLWIWLTDKAVNVKISSNNLHITGCKKVEHAAETARLLQLHILVLLEKQFGQLPEEPLEDTPYFVRWPYVLRFDVCMINYNFTLGVALDLPAFDIFISRNYAKFAFSSYDQNVNGTGMPLECPMLAVKYTINDNGQISMCVKDADIEISLENVVKAYKAFYVIVNSFKTSLR